MAISWRPGLRIDIDPNARKDYTFDFSAWLPEDRTILDYEILSSAGITVEQQSSSEDNTEVTVWVSGVERGELETVTVRIRLDTAPVFSDDFTVRFRGAHK